MVRVALCAAVLLSWGAAAFAEGVDEHIAVLARGGPGVERAIERLRYLGAERSGPKVRALLSNEDAAVRANASRALALLRDHRSAAALAGVLDDSSWEVRRNAAEGLGALKATQYRGALELRLRNDTNRRVRKATAAALGGMGGSSKRLVECAARDPDLEVRLGALDALATGQAKEASGGLRRLLTDPASFVRFGAARALAWNGDAEGRRFLERELSSKDSESSQRALVVLSDVPKTWATDVLAKVAEGTSTLAFDAAAALAKRTDTRGFAVLARMSLGAGDDARRAGRMLDELGIDAEERKRLVGERP